MGSEIVKQKLSRLFLYAAFIIIWAAWGYMLWSLR